MLIPWEPPTDTLHTQRKAKLTKPTCCRPNTMYFISRCMRLNLMPHAANTRYHIPMYCGCYKMLGKINTFPKKVNIHPQLANISRCGGSSQFRQCQDLVSAYYCNPFLYLCHTLRGVVSRNDSRGQCVSHLCI